MPELPEVETIKGGLERKILGKKITGVKIRNRKIIKSQFNDFIKILLNNSFTAISRVGKLLILKLADKNNFLLIHLKMTGQLVYCFKDKLVAGGHSLSSRANLSGIGDQLPNKYSHVVFKFKSGAELFFNDMRRFGYLKIVNESELKKIIGEYGPEPLSRNFNVKRFREILAGRTTSIKAVLLNQKLIAGIGNIYADEILFAAQVRPNRRVNTLSAAEEKRIFQAVNRIIKRAIKYRGTTFNNYIDAAGRKGNFTKFLKVYGREGEECFRCSEILIKKKIASRGTRYCPRCQK